MLPSRTLAALALLVAAYLVRRACRRTRKENLKYTCGIVGGGVGGVAAAYRLQKAGVQVFLYDVAPDFGGTWLHNSYPDCGCDVFSHAYSFSFAPNADWTRKFSKRDEILAYVQKTASDMGLRARAKFNTKVVSATFDGRVWELQLEDQATKQVSKVSHNFLVGATGQLNVPLFPRGVDAHAFKGPAFHTARWDHQVDLAGKRVACVGTGASAIQALPAIADKVRELVVFQRSPGWVVDKADYLYPSWAKFLFKYVPWARSLHRAFFFAFMDYVWAMMVPRNATTQSLSNRLLQQRFVGELNVKAPLPELISTERLGCKRLLISDDWLPMFRKPNVRLVSSPVVEVLAGGLKTADGREHPADVVIFATGFATNDFLPNIDVRVKGRAKSLHETWGDTPHAYKGVMVSGFPNLGLVYGPNTNVNHTSVLALMECALDQFGMLVEKVLDSDAASIDVLPEAQKRYDDSEQAALQQTVFNADCTSWYKRNSAKRIVNNYHGSLLEFWLATRRVDWRDFRVSSA